MKTKIKPLEWLVYGMGWRAHTPFGSIVISPAPSGWRVYLPNVHNCPPTIKTEASAKKQARQWWEQQVRACLETPA